MWWYVPSAIPAAALRCHVSKTGPKPQHAGRQEPVRGHARRRAKATSRTTPLPRHTSSRTWGAGRIADATSLQRRAAGAAEGQARAAAVAGKVHFIGLIGELYRVEAEARQAG